MGRKTWESIPVDKRPLANRVNVVLSRNEDFQAEKALVYKSLSEALQAMNSNPLVKEVFIIGGQALFEEAVSDAYRPLCKMIIATRINRDYEFDVGMPSFEEHFSPLYISQTYSQPKDELTWDYCFFGNRSLLAQQPHLIPTELFKLYPKHPEYQYLECIKEVMA